MSLLLLFNNQVAASSDVAVQTLIETAQGQFADVSGYLVTGKIVRGRQRELDDYRAGRCTLTLRNDTRRFDPTYTAGPYYGNIKPMRRLQVTGTYSGITRPLFTGYIDRWTQRPEGPHTGSTVVEATDAFKVLARAQLPVSAYAAEVLADTPRVWWRFGEPAGATSALDSVAAVPAPQTALTGYTVQSTFGADSLIARDTSDLAWEQPSTTQLNGLRAAAGTASFTGSAFTVEMIVKFSNVAAGTNQTLLSQADQPSRDLVWLYKDNNERFHFSVVNTAGTICEARSTSSVVVSTSYHVMATYTAGTMKIYVNGADVTDSLSANNVSITNQRPVLLAYDDQGNGSMFTGVMDEVALYSTALSAARALAHYQAVATPWDNDLPGARATRVMTVIGYTGPTNFDTGQSVLQPAELDMSALEHLQKVAASEMGALYVEADGTLRLKGRAALAVPVSEATLTDAVGSNPAIRVYEPELGDDLIRNDVTVSRLDGAAQHVKDTSSITAYLTQSYVLDGLYHDDDTLSRNMAELIVSEHADPSPRISGIEVRPRANPATLFPQVLALELTDTITVKVTPQRVGSEVTQTSMVDRLEHTFGPKEWETTLTVSPAPGAVAGCFLQLDTGPCGLDTARLYV